MLGKQVAQIIDLCFKFYTEKYEVKIILIWVSSRLDLP